MQIFIHGLSVKNFLGIDNDFREVIGLGRFSFFIGPNNSGKSTILDLVHRYLPMHNGGQSTSAGRMFDVLDQNRSANAGELRIRVATPVKVVLDRIEKQLSDAGFQGDFGYVRKAVDWMARDGYLWLEGVPPYGEKAKWAPEKDPSELHAILNQGELQRLWSRLTNMTGGGPSHWASGTIEKIATLAELGLPEILLIPAFRRIGPLGDGQIDVSGAGLIDRLAQLQNPALDKRSDTEIFEKINNFVREVTNRPEAKIEVPYSREHILVHMDGRVLPLDSLGTGIHQVIMLAAFCTVYDEKVICLEEPELHLHPLLQRRLIDYLRDNTKNQYLIATHSAAFLDMPEASIYRVWQEDGATHIRRAVSRQQRFEICSELGHRASDLLQCNAVIWVEGPSDRFYINHWLHSIAPELEESLHYSIMFYGGRLLSHLSADDEQVDDFISLRDLNRNLAVIIDSDKKTAQANINATKIRVARELSESGFVWITKGREIENYVPHEALQAAVSSIHSKYTKSANGGQFDHALHYFRSTGKRGASDELVEAVDKVRVAKIVCNAPADLSRLDLELRIQELAAFIRRANGMNPGQDQVPA